MLSRALLAALCLAAALPGVVAAKKEKKAKDKKKLSALNCTELFEAASGILRELQHDRTDTAESWRFKRHRAIDKALKHYTACFEGRQNETNMHMEALMFMAHMQLAKEEVKTGLATLERWPEDDRGTEYYYRKAEILAKSQSDAFEDAPQKGLEALQHGMSLMSSEEGLSYEQFRDKMLGKPLGYNITEDVLFTPYGNLLLQSLANYYIETEKNLHAYSEAVTISQLFAPYNNNLRRHIGEIGGKFGSIQNYYRVFAPTAYEDWRYWTPELFAHQVGGFLVRIPQFVKHLAKELASDMPDAVKATYADMFKAHCGVDIDVTQTTIARGELLKLVATCMEKQGIWDHMENTLSLLNYGAVPKGEDEEEKGGCAEGDDTCAAEPDEEKEEEEVRPEWTLADLFAHHLYESRETQQILEDEMDVTLSHYAAVLGEDFVASLVKRHAFAFDADGYNGTTPTHVAVAMGVPNPTPAGGKVPNDRWKREPAEPCWKANQAAKKKNGKNACAGKGDELYLEKIEDVMGDYDPKTEWGRIKPNEKMGQKLMDEFEAYMVYEDREDFNDALFGKRVGLSPALDVDYVTYVDRKRFVKEYLSLARPVILGESQPLDDEKEREHREMFKFYSLAQQFAKVELHVTPTPHLTGSIFAQSRPEKKPMVHWSFEDVAKYTPTTISVHMRWPWREVLVMPEALEGLFNLNRSDFEFVQGGAGAGTGMRFIESHFADHMVSQASRRVWLLVPPSHAYYSGLAPEESFKEALQLKEAGMPVYEFNQVYGDTIFVPAGWSFCYINLRGAASYEISFPYGAVFTPAKEVPPMMTPEELQKEREQAEAARKAKEEKDKDADKTDSDSGDASTKKDDHVPKKATKKKKSEKKVKVEEKKKKKPKTQPVTPAGDSYGNAVTEEEILDDDVGAARKDRQTKIAEERKKLREEKQKRPKPEKKKPKDGEMYTDDEGQAVMGGSMTITPQMMKRQDSQDEPKP